MNVAMLLEMAAQASPDRTAIGSRGEGLSYADLLERAQRAATLVKSAAVSAVGLVDTNSPAVPILLFASGFAGTPFVPMNYRLSDDRLRELVARTAPSLVVADEPSRRRLSELAGVTVLGRTDAISQLDGFECVTTWSAEPERIAVLLFTSGTTGPPKAAVLRHRHLTSYILSTVDFMVASEEEAALVAVPPYHIAGISTILSSVFAGRRMVQLDSFDAHAWVELARTEQVTHAMVVPTMLGRILDVLDTTSESLPDLRHLAYGGGQMPIATIERALNRLPHVEFVNAYGLTETSSTIALLSPEDHRAAHSSGDERLARRLGSVGKPVPGVEIEVRDQDGTPLPAGAVGEIWVRGSQIAGEYLHTNEATRDGWFCTRDRGLIDEGGYLFLDGRADDVIVRGGENIAPGEIEEVLSQHPDVAEVAVVGMPDAEWGEQLVAAVVLREGRVEDAEALRSFVRARLRSARTPERIEFLSELPYNEMGKLLRRDVRATLALSAPSDVAVVERD